MHLRKLELIATDEKITYSGFSIGFEVDNLEEIKEKLNKNNYVIMREISPHASLTLCFLEGPNGKEVELIIE